MRVILDTLPSIPESVSIADPNDAFLVAMSLAAEADYLLTGDRKAGLLELGNVGRTRVMTPNGFCQELELQNVA